MATRISLIRSARLKEQRGQIGNLSSPLHDVLLDLEKSSLLCLSERSRGVNQTQIALNSIVRAQKLERVGSSETAQEFANVLWLMKEPKLAIKSLATVLASTIVDKMSQDVEAKVKHATLLSRLVSLRGSSEYPQILTRILVGHLVCRSVYEEAFSDRERLF